MAEHFPNSSAPVIRVIPAALPNVNELIRQGFDLSSEFAVRWIIAIGLGKLELYVVSHHIAVDGTAMSALSVELFNLLKKHSDNPAATDMSTIYSQAHLYEVCLICNVACHSLNCSCHHQHEKAAYISSSAFADAKTFWLAQVYKVTPIVWKKDMFPLSQCSDYRAIETWADFPKAV